MGVYISGLEIPPKGKGAVVILCSSGAVYSGGQKVGTAVPVPPHGWLIDGSVAEVISFTDEDARGKDFADGILYAADFISEQPTIIPAEEERVCENCGWFGGLMCDHIDENGKCLGWKPEESDFWGEEYAEAKGFDPVEDE